MSLHLSEALLSLILNPTNEFPAAKDQRVIDVQDDDANKSPSIFATGEQEIFIMQ